MRGLQLQTALALVAEGRLADDEIAKLLNVRLSALEQAMKEPYFERRVEEMRSGRKSADDITRAL
jgi:hypothetical protein